MVSDKAPRIEDDLEAQAADHSSDGLGGHSLEDEKGMGEYERLDRYITSGGHQQDEAVEEEPERIPAWKFWKSSDQGNDIPVDNKPPPEWLDVDIRKGISDADVETRRKRFGFNELTAEKENQLAKFLSFFQGPILYGKCHMRCETRTADHTAD